MKIGVKLDILFREGSLVNILIKRSKRKTISIEIDTSLNVILRLPLKFPEHNVPGILDRYTDWIESAIDRRKKRNELYPFPDSEKERILIEEAKSLIPDRVKFYSELTGLIPTGIKITKARTRLGSCSGKNSLCFSYLLMQYPDECIDYVVLHEIAHIKYHNHSKDFYALVEKNMPDYRDRVRKLKSQ